MKAKKATCAAALASALSLLAAVPNVSDVSFVQDPDTRRVTIGYQIDVPSVVTVDVQTNRGDGTFVTVGAKNLRHVSGAVNRLVTAAHAPQTIGWSPDLAWGHGAKIPGADVKAVVTAWATNAPPDYMVFNLLDLDDVRYYADAESLPFSIGDRRYK